MRTWLLGLFAASTMIAVGCGDKNDNVDAGVVDAGAGDSGVSTLYSRLGGASGISSVIDGFLGRVSGDAKINGFFLNSSVNGVRLSTCLKKQVGALTGGPEVYPTGDAPADSDGCRTMAVAHDGMGVSMADFNDLAGHLVAEMTSAGVAEADRNTIVAALVPLAPQIVERPLDNEQLYNKLGRKPTVVSLIDDFTTRVLADAEINGFFTDTNADRLKVCLVRQVCGALGGPCKYGEEVGDELFTTPCRAMLATHQDLTNPSGGSGRFITKADFDALVTDLVASMTMFDVSSGDQSAILSVLGPLCPDIVKTSSTCN